MTEPSDPADITASLGTECSAAEFPEQLPLEEPALPHWSRPAEARPRDGALDVVGRVLDELHGRLGPVDMGPVDMGPGDLGPGDLRPRHRGERGRLTSLSATARIHPPLTRGDLGMLAQVARTPPEGVRREDEVSDRSATGQTAQPPPAIAGFTDLVEVGRGSAGRVYRAWQGSLRRTVALKVMTSEVTAESIGRAQREARALAVLNHPHVLTIHEAALQHSPPFLVMEWIPGGSLQERLRRGPLSITEATQVARQLASGVAACHDLDIVHRDLKPGNVLLATRASESARGTASGETLCVKITDFGLVRLADHSLQLTQEGGVVGTPGFMAPEQTGLRPQLGPVGRLSDIYGVGAVVFASLTGRPPHVGSTPLETLAQAAWEEPHWLPQLRPDIPGDLAVIVSKCLRIAPEDRYASARELLEDLERFESGRPIRAQQYTVWQRARNWMRGHPTASAVGGLTIAVLLAAVLAGGYHVYRLNTMLADLEQERTRVLRLLGEAEEARFGEERNRRDAVQQAVMATEVMLRSIDCTPQPSPQDLNALKAFRGYYLRQISALDDLDQQQAEVIGQALLTACSVEWLWRVRNDETLLSARCIEQLLERFPRSSLLAGAAMRALAIQWNIHLVQERQDEAGHVLQRLLAIVDRQETDTVSLPPIRWVAGIVSDLWRADRADGALQLATLSLHAEQQRFRDSSQDGEDWSIRLGLEAQRIGLLQQVGNQFQVEEALQRWIDLSREFERHYPDRSPVILGERWRLITQQLRHLSNTSEPQNHPLLLELGLACMADFQKVAEPGPPLVTAGLEWCRLLLESRVSPMSTHQVSELTEEVLRRGGELAGLGDLPDLRLDLGRVQVLLGEREWNEGRDALALEYARRAQGSLEALPPDHKSSQRELRQACDLAARTSGRLGWTAEELSHLSRAWSLATEEERAKIEPRLQELSLAGRHVSREGTPVPR
ncbi:MAG TPA: hypothetical protein DDY91_16725 [Planctomycetaceae bacterium]|nr:hypothetical protein [Planctomycetaceae bacterium]